MSQIIKTTCARCNGSGRYSFNLMHGTKCYGCNGAGFVLTDAAKAKRAEKAKAARDAKREDSAALRVKIAAEVRAELDAQLGPFAGDEKGSHDRCSACFRAFGKMPGEFVAERMASAA